MDNLQERFNELINERNQTIARLNEINGALQEIQRLANPEPQEEQEETVEDTESNDT